MLENNFCTCSDFYDTSLVLIMLPKYHTASKWGKKKRKRVFNGNSKNNSQEQAGTGGKLEGEGSLNSLLC